MNKKQRARLAELGLLQMVLDDMPPEIPREKRKPKLSIWYYITRKSSQEMLAGFDDNGYPIWIEHDLRTTYPHLINNIRTAQTIAHTAGNGIVERYPYVVKRGH